MPPHDRIKDTPEYFGINPHHEPQYLMAPERLTSDLETKRIFQGTTIRQISFLSYAIIGGYIRKSLTYDVHHRGFRLVGIVEAYLDKDMGKDRYPRSVFINLCLVRWFQLMKLWSVQ